MRTNYIILFLSLLFFFLFLSQIGFAQQPARSECPSGSYEIGRKEPGGDPICKLEPTGCPYGDSIPLGPQCDKHKPVEVQQQEAAAVEEPIVEEYQTFQGK